ncbi:SixA phosphatase family protein [Methyloceanibacter caenitepidi]|uniref:Phosphohistidine phosphatase SixA n=1 Tax=Methyloceanibacter caenitepidi TaxID=1384459 RepID=A0A0A8K3R8_9HYPH|nr:histidine phosphatase family protein [Methyloceanibacter caenitepidi]BAQ17555.1 phosphohistidine phosphatase SixA [Methyloceanibacter caenitepidi]
MLTLSLLRHAKSSWKNPALPDRERPLNARGMGDAPVMGRAMSKRGIDPELILCSSAQRTVDTLALVLPELKIEPEVVYDDALYHASPDQLLDMLRNLQPGARSVLLVGHNPEIQALALGLIGAGPKELRDRLAEKYPTGGLAVINFTAGLWSSVDVGSGSLSLFLAPRDIRGDAAS